MTPRPNPTAAAVLGRVTTSRLCAGVVTSRLGIITSAAPVLRYAIGWHIDRLRVVIEKQGGSLQIEDAKPPERARTS